MRGTRSLVARALALVLVVVLAATMLLPALAIARAGGGHVGGGSRSGGGSSFSGGSSSGGSSGGGIVVLPTGGSGGGGIGCGNCCSTLPIIIIVIIVLVVLSRAKKGQGGTPAPFNAGATPAPVLEDPLVQPPAPEGDVFAEIKTADPNFNDQMFFGRVNEMFIAIQYAWMNRNLEPVRRFLADQQFSVLNNSVQNDYVLKGQVNKLDNVHVDWMQPVEVTRQGDYDSVKMLITATVIDYTVDERTGQLVNPGELGDGKTPTTFQEYWTFVRKSGAQSKFDASIQKCPNCGAPVTDGNYVKCAYCGVQMNDPTLDWVLMRIEQT